jgi:metal-sulfur cluster biosynthetic enzyme
VQQTTSAVANQIASALESVLDPCSRFNGTRLSLVELGMVSSIEVDDHGHARVILLLDDPVCIYAAVICQEVETVVRRTAGVWSVEISIRADTLWTPELMSPGAQEKLSAWQAERRRSLSLARSAPDIHDRG